MKAFEAPKVEIVHFAKTDVMTGSCPTDCTCVDCHHCDNGDHCTYFDTCPEYVAPAAGIEGIGF